MKLEIIDTESGVQDSTGAKIQDAPVESRGWKHTLWQTAKVVAIATAAGVTGYFGLRLLGGWMTSSPEDDRSLVFAPDSLLQLEGLLEGDTMVAENPVAARSLLSTPHLELLTLPSESHDRSRRTNSPPVVINPVPDQVIEAGQPYRYCIDTLTDYQDADGDKIFLSATLEDGSPLPSWLVFQQRLMGNYNTPNNAHGVAVSGNLALVADEASGLQIIDISMPASPTLVGTYDTPSYALSVAVSGNLALVADGDSGLLLIDIATPADPTLVGTYNTPGWAYGVAVSGNLALVADGSSGLQIINITTPASPSWDGTYNTPDWAYNVAVSGNLALVADRASGLQIINITTPASPTRVGTYNTPGAARGVAVSGNLALVADEDSGLQIIDIATPASPTMGGIYNTPSSAYGVAVSGNLALVADINSGLQIISLMQYCFTSELVPLLGALPIKVIADDHQGGQVVDSFLLKSNQYPYANIPIQDKSIRPETAFQMNIKSDLAFVDADGDTLSLAVRQTDGSSLPSWLQFYSISFTAGSYGGWAEGKVVAVSGNLALVTGEGGSSLQIIDIATPARPTLVGTCCDTPSIVNGIAVSGNLAVVTGDYSLQIINITTPASPLLMCTYDITPRDQIKGVAVSGNLALVAGDRSLQIIDITTPANSTLVGTLATTPGSALSVAVSGNLALVANDYLGLQIIDIAIPASPRLVGTFATTPGDQIKGVAVSGNLALVSNDYSGLQVIDITTPASPSLVGTFATTSIIVPGDAYGVAVSGTLALVAGGGSGLQLVDIATPANPTLVGTYDTPGSARGVAASGNLALVADGSSGLQLIDISNWRLSGTPSTADAGNYALVVTATDTWGGSASNSFVFRVEGPPMLRTAIAPQLVEVGKFFMLFSDQYWLDLNADPIIYTATLADENPLPSWLGFTGGMSGIFSGTPESDDAGNFNITITASDRITPAVSTTFALTVDHFPIVSVPLLAQAANVGQLFNYTIPIGSFTDADANAGDTLTYAATLADGSSLPAWLNFTAGTYSFNGTATTALTTPLSVKVTATDTKGGSASTTFGLSVQHFPSIQQSADSVSVVADIGRGFSYTIPFDRFTDLDGDPLTFTATKADDGSSLPSWISFDGAIRQFMGTPQGTDKGVLSIKVIASDGRGGSASDTFDIIVEHFPIVAQAISMQAANVGESFSYQIPARTFTDDDVNDTLTYAATLADGSSLPTWLNFTAGTLSFNNTLTPPVLTTPLSVKITATDTKGGSASTTFGLSVQHFPSIQQSADSVSVVADIGKSFSYTIPLDRFTDSDGDPLTFTATKADGSSLPAWISFDGAIRQFTGTSQEYRDLSINVTASDGRGGSASDTFNIVVEHFPVVAQPISLQAADVGQLFNYTIPIDSFTDADDTLTYAATLADGSPLPTWLSFNVGTRTFSGTPDTALTTPLSVKVTATDTKGGTASTTFDLSVQHFPVLFQPIPNQIAVTDERYDFTFDYQTFVDADSSDILIFRATQSDGASLPAWLNFDAVVRRLYGNPGEPNLIIRMMAEDGHGGSAWDEFNLLISSAMPTPPRFIEGRSFVYALNNTFDAVPEPIVNVSAQQSDGIALPDWMIFDEENWQLHGTALAGEGEYQIRLTATTNTSETYSRSFMLNFYRNQRPEEITRLSNQVTGVDSDFKFAVPAETFTDADGDSLAYSAHIIGNSPWPAWLHFDEKTRTFWGTPRRSDTNLLNTMSSITIPLEVRASDGQAAASSEFLLSVNGSSWFEVGLQVGSVMLSVMTAYLRRSILLNRLRDKCVKKPQEVAETGEPYEFKIPGKWTVRTVRMQMPRKQVSCSCGDRFFAGRWPYMDLPNGKVLPDWLEYNLKTRTLTGTPAAKDEGRFVIEAFGNSSIIKHMFVLEVGKPKVAVVSSSVGYASHTAAGAEATSITSSGVLLTEYDTEQLASWRRADRNYSEHGAAATFFAAAKPPAQEMREVVAEEVPPAAVAAV